MAHFVAERYLASVDSSRLRADVDRIRRAARRVRGVSFVESVYLPADDLCLYVFTGESAEQVADVARLAAVDVDRIRQAEVAR